MHMHMSTMQNRKVSERIQKIKSLRKQTNKQFKMQQEKAEEKSRNFYIKGYEFLD